MDYRLARDRGTNLLSIALGEKKFVCTAELVLGRDHNAAEAEAFVREASQQADGIKIISLTDLPGGNPALPPEAFASYVRERGLTPIAHLSGKDGNRSFLEGRLHALARAGVENILALSGDAQKSAYGGKGKPVHDLDSVLILDMIRKGYTENKAASKEECAHWDFFAGAVVNPYKVREPDLLMQFYKMQLKIAAGAKFLVTQLGFNLRKLFELKQYMVREGIGHIPVLANVYVATARIARMMQAGEIAGCVISDELIKRLQGEKKPQRLERAGLMVAAVKDLGFNGAHIGGFALTHQDFMYILERASAIGSGWRGRMDELTFAYPNEFYLFPAGQDGFSHDSGEYQVKCEKPRGTWTQHISEAIYRNAIREGSSGARFFSQRLKSDGAEQSLWTKVLSPSTLYRKATLGCVDCGDCVQDHLNYAGCSMRWCYKELRNGPCGGSRVDGTCEARPEQDCIWNQIYLATLAAGDDPKKFAHVLVPPRNWSLDKTNALVNRFTGGDNATKRIDLTPTHKKDEERC